MKKKLSVLLCLSMIVLAMVGCGKSQTTETPSAEANTIENEEVAVADDQEKPEKLVMYCDSYPAPYMQTIADQYEERYGIKIELVVDSYANLHDKIVTAAASGSQVDIGRMDTCWPAEFLESGIAEPLDQYFTDGFAEQFIPATLEQMTVDGKIVSTPMMNGSKWVYYNATMLETGGYSEFPSTWEEVKAMCSDLVDQGIARYGTALSLSQAEGLVCEYAGLLEAFDGTWKDENGNWILNSENAIATTQFLVDSLGDGFVDPASITYDDTATLNSFMAKDVVFITSWAGNTATLDEESSPIKGEYKVACLPGTQKYGTAGGGTTGGGGLFIFADSQYKEWAWKFLEMTVEDEVQIGQMNETGDIPVTYSAIGNADLLAENPDLEVMAQQFENVLIRPVLANYNEWSSMLQQHLHSALTGAKSPEDALNAAQEAAKKMN